MSKRSRKKRSRSNPPPRYRKRQKEQARQNRDTAKNAVSAPPRRHLASPQLGRVVTLDPLMPIIVRSGRPTEGMSDADPARLPPPSTIAGCLRTAWARSNGEHPPFSTEFVQQLTRLSVAGPLLLAPGPKQPNNTESESLDATASSFRILIPKPADARYFGNGEDARCVRSAPRPFANWVGADLPDGMLPARSTEEVQGKPGAGPAWWDWEDLLTFRLGGAVEHARLSVNGWSPPAGDRRAHVTIDPATHAARDGQMFQTEGLDLEVGPARHDETPQRYRLRHGSGSVRLLARCAEPLGATLVHLGGKRRLAFLQPESERAWPTPPAEWFDRILKAGGLSLTLLTPGIFSAGYRPGWVGGAALSGNPPSAPRLRLKLCAAAVERWQPHSGWDLAKGKPRPARKLAGAGATYWFRMLDGDADAVTSLWLASICDDEQDRRDGFGLAMPSPWTPAL